jgi:hypothetical protein
MRHMSPDSGRKDRRWSYRSQAAFYATHFRAPAVPDAAALSDWLSERPATKTDCEARAEMVQEVEAASALMTSRAEAVMLVDSFIFSAAVVLLSVHFGTEGLMIAAALCAFASLWFSLFAQLMHAGRETLGISAGDPTNSDVDEIARRLARKAALSADGVVLLYPAATTMLLGALIS